MPQDRRNIYKIAREAKGLTQEATAEKLGISDSSIRAYETGQRIPPPEVVDLMVIAYDSQLLGIQHLRASADMARSIVPDIREVRLPEAIMEPLDRVYGFVDAHRDRELRASARTALSTIRSAPSSTPSWRSWATWWRPPWPCATPNRDILRRE
ncbi:MAG: helix-turn-helix domain-containing protein [Flavonifractor plautii]